MDVAVAFALEARKSRKRQLAEAALKADIPSKISDWFLSMPLERWCQLQQPDCAQDQRIHEEAAKYVAKWRTASWITQQNYQCGVAPTYDKLVQKYHEELEKRQLGHLAHRLLTSAEGRDGARGCAGRAARAWCGRFCKRFAFTRKRLGAGAQLPADELEDKARYFVFSRMFRGFVWGHFRPLFGPVLGPVSGPVLGPAFGLVFGPWL